MLEQVNWFPNTRALVEFSNFWDKLEQFFFHPISRRLKSMQDYVGGGDQKNVMPVRIELACLFYPRLDLNHSVFKAQKKYL